MPAAAIPWRARVFGGRGVAWCFVGRGVERPPSRQVYAPWPPVPVGTYSGRYRVLGLDLPRKEFSRDRNHRFEEHALGQLSP